MAGKEVKWGIFVASGVIVLFAIFLLFGEFKFFSKGYNIFVSFNFTNGLEENAPVRLAGVNVGTVDDVQMVYDQKGTLHVMVRLWIREDIRLREDSRFYINTLGLLGEKYVEISPGTISEPLLPDNSTVAGIDPMSTEELFVKGNEIANNLDQIMSQLSQLISTDSIDIFMGALESVTAAMNTADTILRENRKNILEATTAVNQSAMSLPRVAVHVEKVAGELEQGFAGKGEKIDAIITNLEDFSRSLDELSTLMAEINRKIQEKEGSVGRLMGEEELYENINEASEELKLLLEDIKKNPRKYFKFSVF
ncbi:MAG TPA: MlaD family protein [Candidatus Mcinerneyibacteriales bacterium]|nr:MlaD family protein [Candidatus Mcinerneyibacteriales bacterium]